MTTEQQRTDHLIEATRILQGDVFLPFELFPTGSRVICPQVVHHSSDWDYVGLVPSLNDASNALMNAGWLTGTSMPDSDEALTCDFVSFKKDDVNLLLTATRDWLDKFLLATSTAMRLGLTEKGQRILLFQAILYGKAPVNCQVPAWSEPLLSVEAKA